VDIIRLQHLEFFGRHGTELWEKQTGCRFTVDLELAFDAARAAQSDRLEDTLDYRVIYSRARHVVEHESHNLIERVAWRLIHEMFRTFPIAQATVRVAKPEARIGGLNRAVEVELRRTREQWEREAAAEAELNAADREANA
jgi:dihydroneopterin aldolase